MTTKHTPTPWLIKDGIIQGGVGQVYNLGHVNCYRTTEGEANAAFIVKAVNCHDELVQAA